MASGLPTKEELEIFQRLIAENRYDFVKLAYIIFPFGEKGHELEFIQPYDWQIEEWQKISKHLQNPATRYETYRLIISSGNGAAKTSFGAMTYYILMYTQQVRARIMANTKPQMTSVVWPEYDIWFRRARFSNHFFEKLGESIKARDPEKAETWRLDAVTWNEATPASVSGLHNYGKAIAYILEEAPGIPSVIWKYTSGAMTDIDTIKIIMAFGNSDDPESQFEQNMSSPEWRARRIDTREMSHVDPKQIASWLREAGGDEDNDDFRVRVRGLPRKSSKDSITKLETINAALERGKTFDREQVHNLPSVLTCDPAWQDGDDITIWHHQGFFSELLEKYKLSKAEGQDHRYTYEKLCYWEKERKVDKVLIDQGEGTTLKTMANTDSKHHWELISFANTPNDTPEFKDSEFHNMRAQMYYQTDQRLKDGAAIAVREPEWEEDVRKQMTWTKGGRHKTSLKKIAEPKADIKTRVGKSPDVSDGLVLFCARKVTERLEENEDSNEHPSTRRIGGNPLMMPKDVADYEMQSDEYRQIYD